MRTMVSRVHMQSIDINQVINVREVGPNVYAFFVNISSIPSPEWKNCFKIEWQKQQNNLLMPQILQGSARIQLMFRLEEEIQVYINKLTEVIDKCNDTIWQYDVRAAARRAEKRNTESDAQVNIAMIKEQLKAILLN